VAKRWVSTKPAVCVLLWIIIIIILQQPGSKMLMMQGVEDVWFRGLCFFRRHRPLVPIGVMAIQKQ